VGLLNVAVSLAREPVRLTLRAWELGLSSAASAARLGLELLDGQREDSPAWAERYPPPPAHSGGNGAPPGPSGADAPSAVADSPSAVADSPPAVPDELVPDHVDEEVVLVAETAEEGAEDGAGPELHIDEPWDGYDEMTAPQINDRLVAATPELAAAVELYESTRKSRRTVLEAAERALSS
jgi:hypothetical protein